MVTGIFPSKYRMNFPSAFNMADIKVNYAKATRDRTFVSAPLTDLQTNDSISVAGHDDDSHFF